MQTAQETVSDNPRDIAALCATAQSLQERIATLEQSLQRKEATIHVLTEQLRLLRHRHVGQSTEQPGVDQLADCAAIFCETFWDIQVPKRTKKLAALLPGLRHSLYHLLGTDQPATRNRFGNRLEREWRAAPVHMAHIRPCFGAEMDAVVSPHDVIHRAMGVRRCY